MRTHLPDYWISSLLDYRNCSESIGIFVSNDKPSPDDQFLMSMGLIKKIPESETPEGFRYEITSDGLDELHHIANRYLRFLILQIFAYNSIPLATAQIYYSLTLPPLLDKAFLGYISLLFITAFYYLVHVEQYIVGPYIEIRRRPEKLVRAVHVLLSFILPLVLYVLFW